MLDSECLFGPGFCPPALLPYSVAVGVGNNPHSVSLVIRTDVPSSQHSPPHVIPHAVKVLDNGAESTGSQERTVFREDKLRLNLSNDSEILLPKSRTLAGNSCTFTRRTDVLAGESSADDIDSASPRFSVEGTDIVPYREAIEHPVSLSL
jgi:hypothetical protein